VQDAAGLADDLDQLTVGTINSRDSWPDDDIVSGRAGAILALLALDRTDRQDSAPRSALAVELGRELVTSLASRRMLTGMAHGASGFGVALLRLYTRTGLCEFLDAGRAALDWEDSLFDEIDGTWPDLRDSPTGAAPRGRAAVTWCNGAAGIAIARLAAATDDPGRRTLHLARARTALELTRRRLTSASPEDDNSLCHGTAGLAETLLLGSEALEEPELATEARDAMTAAISHHTWRGTTGQDFVRANPSFMLGAAGIGHQLLRLHAPTAVPTVLGGPRP
jgi:lantibiotic modifying enzyme